MEIQEIAKELCELTIKEVNELATVMRNGCDMPGPIAACRKEDTTFMSPKEYGMRMKGRRHRHKY